MVYGTIQNGLRMATLRLMQKICNWAKYQKFPFCVITFEPMNIYVIIFHNNAVHSASNETFENLRNPPLTPCKLVITKEPLTILDKPSYSLNLCMTHPKSCPDAPPRNS
jgi:hypothetical protein